MNVEGKRILITGGSSGIGLATAQALIAKGARVCITGRRQELVETALTTLRDAGGEAAGISADVATDDGRRKTLQGALAFLGGLDILINNAGAVRAGSLEDISEQEVRTMIDVDLVAPILLTRAALPSLRASGDGLVVNIASGIALIGMPFYTTYAAVKAGLAHFGEALRRELNGEGVRVLTVYPGATDTPMMTSSHAGPDLGFTREPPTAVADALVAGIESQSLEVIRGGVQRAAMIAQNRSDPAVLDQRFLEMKALLADAVRNHKAL